MLTAAASPDGTLLPLFRPSSGPTLSLLQLPSMAQTTLPDHFGSPEICGPTSHKRALVSCELSPTGKHVALSWPLSAIGPHLIILYHIASGLLLAAARAFPPRRHPKHLEHKLPRAQFSPAGTHLLVREIRGAQSGRSEWMLLDMHGHCQQRPCDPETLRSLVGWALGGRYLDVLDIVSPTPHTLASFPYVIVKGYIWDAMAETKVTEWEQQDVLTKSSLLSHGVTWARSDARCFIPACRRLLALPSEGIRDAVVQLTYDDSIARPKSTPLYSDCAMFSPCGSRLLFFDTSFWRVDLISHGKIDFASKACVMRLAAVPLVPQISGIAWHPSLLGCVYAVPLNTGAICILDGVQDRCVLYTSWCPHKVPAFYKPLTLAWSPEGFKLAATIPGDRLSENTAQTAVLSFDTSLGSCIPTLPRAFNSFMGAVMSGKSFLDVWQTLWALAICFIRLQC